MTLREIEPQLAELSRAEKVQALQILIRDLGNVWPGIEKTPGVVGAMPALCELGFRCGHWKIIAVWGGMKRKFWRITPVCGWWI